MLVVGACGCLGAATTPAQYSGLKSLPQLTMNSDQLL